MYTYIWIEGYDNLQQFCEKRFKQKPQMRENSGSVGDAKIHKKYKEDADGNYHEMYFLFMEHPNGKYDSYLDLHDKVERKNDYEQIRLDRDSIPKRRK